jgi:hypothetical protein
LPDLVNWKVPLANGQRLNTADIIHQLPTDHTFDLFPGTFAPGPGGDEDISTIYDITRVDGSTAQRTLHYKGGSQTDFGNHVFVTVRRTNTSFDATVNGQVAIRGRT